MQFDDTTLISLNAITETFLVPSVSQTKMFPVVQFPESTLHLRVCGTFGETVKENSSF